MLPEKLKDRLIFAALLLVVFGIVYALAFNSKFALQTWSSVFAVLLLINLLRPIMEKKRTKIRMFVFFVASSACLYFYYRVGEWWASQDIEQLRVVYPIIAVLNTILGVIQLQSQEKKP